MSDDCDNFLGLDASLSDYAKARFAVLPLPYDATTSYLTGTRHGPLAVIQASQQVEWFDEELGVEACHAGIATLEPVPCTELAPDQMHHAVLSAARGIVADGKYLVGIGGEHSVSSALVEAVRERHEDVCVLQIDAHADLRDEYSGTKYSHASVMRRIVELGAEVVQVGIRSFSQEEHAFMTARGLSPVLARHCHGNDAWIDDVVDRLGDHVYVTIDIDGFDPAYAPGTGTPEPGGLNYYQVTRLLRAVAESRTVVGADVVEVMPLAGQAVTEFLAARLIYKLMGYVTQ